MVSISDDRYAQLRKLWAMALILVVQVGRYYLR